MFIDFVSVFIVIFAVIDPVGTVPIYIAVTRGYSLEVKRKIALYASAVAAVVLIFFLAFGELILNGMSIPLYAFQVSGGVVLFLFALNMVFGDSKPEQELQMLEDNHRETAIFPLAVPSIAGPGAMLTVVLLTENARTGFFQEVQTGLVLLVVLLINFVFMRAAGWIDRRIGKSGASVISRVMGMILASVAVSHVLKGMAVYIRQF